MSKNNDWIKGVDSDAESFFEHLYSEYRESCSKWLQANYNIRPENAPDIFQQAILILYDNIQLKKVQFQEDTKVKTYLYGIAKNLAMSNIRYIKKWSQVNEPEKVFDVILDQDSMVQDENDNAKSKVLSLNKALESIGESCKKLLTLFYYHSLKMNEIAEKLNYTNASTAKAQKYKCIQRLKKLVAHE